MALRPSKSIKHLSDLSTLKTFSDIDFEVFVDTFKILFSKPLNLYVAKDLANFFNNSILSPPQRNEFEFYRCTELFNKLILAQKDQFSCNLSLFISQLTKPNFSRYFYDLLSDLTSGIQDLDSFQTIVNLSWINEQHNWSPELSWDLRIFAYRCVKHRFLPGLKWLLEGSSFSQFFSFYSDSQVDSLFLINIFYLSPGPDNPVSYLAKFVFNNEEDFIELALRLRNNNLYNDDIPLFPDITLIFRHNLIKIMDKEGIDRKYFQKIFDRFFNNSKTKCMIELSPESFSIIEHEKTTSSVPNRQKGL